MKKPNKKLSKITKKIAILIARLKKIAAKRELFSSRRAGQIKRSQKLFFGGLCVIVLLCAVFLLQGKAIKDRPRRKANIKVKESVATQFSGVRDHISPEETFRITITEEQAKTQKSLKDLRSKIGKIIKDNGNRNTSDIDLVKRRVEFLEKKLKKSSGTSSVRKNENKPIERININLTSKKKIDTIDNTIPAGAFAKGVLLSGLDGHTALSASSNPTPLVIEITDPGNLPRKFKSDLKGCRVIASGYGDLSSERINVRLEKLTCIERATGEYIHTAVAGFITGEDGRAGIRGRAKETNRAYLVNSVIGGIISGFGNTLSPREEAAYISLVNPKPPTVRENFQRGFAGGMSNSMEYLSKYYIEKAEGIQPIVIVSPGRIIDVIFTEKAEIGSTRVKQEIAKKRDAKRREIARNLAEKDNQQWMR